MQKETVSEIDFDKLVSKTNRERTLERERVLRHKLIKYLSIFIVIGGFSLATAIIVVGVFFT